MVSCQKFNLGKLAQAPGRFELLHKLHSEVDKSTGCGIRAPDFELLQFEFGRAARTPMRPAVLPVLLACLPTLP